VTEHGTAYLFGRSLAERAVKLIEIVHPEHRERPLRAAIDAEPAPRPEAAQPGTVSGRGTATPCSGTGADQRASDQNRTRRRSRISSASASRTQTVSSATFDR
jgi:hypothetical protein